MSGRMGKLLCVIGILGGAWALSSIAEEAKSVFIPNKGPLKVLPAEPKLQPRRFVLFDRGREVSDIYADNLGFIMGSSWVSFYLDEHLIATFDTESGLIWRELPPMKPAKPPGLKRR